MRTVPPAGRPEDLPDRFRLAVADLEDKEARFGCAREPLV